MEWRKKNEEDRPKRGCPLPLLSTQQPWPINGVVLRASLPRRRCSRFNYDHVTGSARAVSTRHGIGTQIWVTVTGDLRILSQDSNFVNTPTCLDLWLHKTYIIYSLSRIILVSYKCYITDVIMTDHCSRKIILTQISFFHVSSDDILMGSWP